MLACTLYIIHQIENRILVSFRNHFIYFPFIVSFILCNFLVIF